MTERAASLGEAVGGGVEDRMHSLDFTCNGWPGQNIPKQHQRLIRSHPRHPTPKRPYNDTLSDLNVSAG